MVRATRIPELEADPKERRYLFFGYAALRRLAEQTGLSLMEAMKKLYNPKDDGSFAVNQALLCKFIWAGLCKAHPRRDDQPLWLGLSEEDIAALMDDYISGGEFFVREASLLMRVFEAAQEAGILPKPGAPQEEEDADPQTPAPNEPST